MASQRIRLVEELLIENESRGLLEIGPAMPPISIVVVLIGVSRLFPEYRARFNPRQEMIGRAV